MDVVTYKFLMGTSAFVIAILGVMLAATAIQPENGLEKLRKARNILVPSYFVLALLSMVCCFTGYDRRVEPASTLFVASFQALLFTMSMLVFIRPNVVRWGIVLRQAGGITVAGIILFVALFCFADYYWGLFYAAIVAYIIQLVIYTRLFMLVYRRTVREVEDYYDNDEEYRLSWIKTGFYSALVVGVMAIPVLFFTALYKYFVPLYVLYYSFMVMWFVNYYRRMKFAMPVITIVPLAAAESVKKSDGEVAVADAAGKERLLKEKLQKYIDEKEYCRKDISSDRVADSFGVSLSFFRQYMKTCHGMDFRSWRKELRLREATRLFDEHAEYGIDEVCEKVGYNNCSNFNRDFKQMTGITPKCYRERVHGEAR
ncbi:helix-turn-helix domain-containing protein [Butyricimonas hominis]|uniref:helix-turn-helix domain-containing protein n=1 Tax=Butyricimonas TaxID=574697 RepID=UPI0035126420